MHLFDLTKKLIDIQSLTGEEKAIGEFLFNYLKEAGFEVRRHEVEENRFNVYAQVGEPCVVLSTHMDTVAPYIALAEDDVFIYGRGACDTKGIIAAMLKAAEQLKNENHGRFGLLFVVDEEHTSKGAIAANSITNSCRYLINGEPTENKMALGSKGSLRARLQVSGIAAHAAYPEYGESAIEKLLDILNELREFAFPDHPVLGATTVNIGLIEGGIQANVIPPEAEATLMFRVVTSIDDIKARLEKIIRGRAKIEYIFSGEPVLIHTLEGYPTMVAAYTTDIPNLTTWGRPILLGPGSILDAHTANEKISKKQLEEAVGIYHDLVVRLLEETENGIG